MIQTSKLPIRRATNHHHSTSLSSSTNRFPLITQVSHRHTHFRVTIPVAAWLFGLCLCLTSVSGIAQQYEIAALQSQIFQVIEKSTPAVVSVQGSGSMFSGVIVSPQGHVLTAGHTIVPRRSYTVTLPDGRRFSASSLGASEQMRGEQLDCGLLKITNPRNLPHVPLGNSSQLSVRQPCISISYPGGQRNRLEPIVRFGYISRAGNNSSMLQSTALMEPGDSGGPLFDLEGRVIGIHSRIGRQVGQNFDVPIDLFKKYWDQLNNPDVFTTAGGKPLPKLGFVGEDTSARDGITLVSVVEGSLAQELGLRANDKLTKVQGNQLARLDDLRPQLQKALSEDHENLSFSILRGEEQIELTMPLSKLNIPRADRIQGMDDAPAEDSKLVTHLPDLSRLLSSSERDLEKYCYQITSKVNGADSKLHATKIADSPYIISKNSLVGTDPEAVVDRRRVKLQVIARDVENDLVLLQLTQSIANGVRFPTTEATPRIGQLILSPDPAGPGAFSVVGTSGFQSNRQASRGYLGVMLRDFEAGGGCLGRAVWGGGEKRRV